VQYFGLEIVKRLGLPEEIKGFPKPKRA